jgi:hypothetical protein
MTPGVMCVVCCVLYQVRSLEGQLADYNLALDKVRTSTDPEEVKQYQRQVSQSGRHSRSAG